MIYGYCLLVLISCLLFPVISAQPDHSDLLILTEEYAPYNYLDDGNLKGISVDLLESVLLQMGLNTTRDSFQVVSWSEGYKTALTRNNTILFSTARTPDREDLFLWAGPIISDTKVLYGISRGDTPLIPDIRSYRIVAVQNDSGIGMALNAGAAPDQITLVSSPHEAIRMVEEEKADVWSYGEAAGREMINRYAQDPDRFSPFMELATSEEYYAFNNQTDPVFVDTVNRTIAEMKMNRSKAGSSEYDRIIYRYQPVSCAESDISSVMVTDLVNYTSHAVMQNTPETFDLINAGVPPYRDADNPGLYVFVYSLNGTLIADAANPDLVGQNMSGKGDVTGKMFRDEMIAGAREYGTGWVQYVFSHPALKGIFPKKAYYRLVTGSDGVPYVVISGRYISCAYLWQSATAHQDRSIEMDIQPDERILLAGTRNDSVQKDIQILRYLPDGRRDPSFGDGGAVVYSGEAGGDDYAFGIVHDGEGNILVAGREHNGHDPDILLLRYTEQGKPDTSFGDHGVVRYAGTGNGTDSARGVVVGKDGMILIIGEMNTSVHKEMVALRFFPDGSLDEGYGKNGLFILNRSADKDSYGFALALDDHDQAVITGGAVIPGNENSSIATVRLDRDGMPDFSFGDEGLVVYQGEARGPDYGNWVSIMPDGKIVVTGAETDRQGSYDIVVIRYNSDGSWDPTFGENGVALYQASGYDYAWGQTIEPDGSIIIAGTTEVNGISTPLLLRYGPDGKPDPSFGEHGVWTFESFGSGMLYGVYRDEAGNLYANGYITKEGKDISLLVKIPLTDG